MKSWETLRRNPSSSSSALRPAASRPCPESSPDFHPTSPPRSSSPSTWTRGARATSARSSPRHATLPIKVVEDTASLEDGVIFVVPSNRLVEIVDHTLRLRPAKPGSVAPSVDLLLETAAAAYGPGLTAVILTGTGSDGSAGAWHVKQAGGAVVIENPATAMFPSMPRSIAPSLVDATADLDSLGRVLRTLLEAGGSAPKGRDARAFAALLDRIRERSGIDFGTYKTATILRRMRGRMSATGHSSLSAYTKQLESDPAEYARLVNSLLIKVTEFFRDPKVFDHLRDKTLPGLIEEARQSGRQLRVWSAGCSTGEEAYSLAITVLEAMGADAGPIDVRVFATDVDTAAIAFARRGLYPPAALKNVPASILRALLHQVRRRIRGLEGASLADDLRRTRSGGARPVPQDRPHPVPECPHLLQSSRCSGQHWRPSGSRSAKAGGWSSDRPRQSRRCRSCTPRSRPGCGSTSACRGRLRCHSHRGRQRDRVGSRRSLSTPRSDRPAGMPRCRPNSTEAAEALLLDLSLGVVVVDERYYITRINTAARRMLGIHGLAFNQDFIHLAETLPSTEVRAAIDAALGGKTTTTVHELEAADVADDRSLFIQTVVRPYAPRPRTVEGAIIELTDVSKAEHGRRAGVRTDRGLERAALVNRRLLRANDELTTLVAQLRLANQSMLQSSEEAQSGREEVETLNEEFQATNEELETLNEELTASVEELRIANEDLAARTESLRLQTVALAEQKQRGEEEHNRLQSVLTSLGDAVVAVDHAGRTLATNPAYDRLFGGPAAEIKPEDLAGLPLPRAEWPQQRAARGEQFRMEFAVSDPDGSRRWFEAVAEPLTSQDRTWGGVVAIRDVSERTMRLSLERLMAAAGHELKTPTAAIHNYLQLVDRNIADGDMHVAGTYTVRALSQTRRLATLIERLLDLSRIQSGQLELLLDVVDVVAVVRSAVDIAQVLPKAPTIRLKAGAQPVLVRADPGRLEQVFVNLLANATEHAPGSGPVDVTITTVGRAGRGVRAGPRPRGLGRGHPDDVRRLYAARRPASGAGTWPGPLRGARDRHRTRRRHRGQFAQGAEGL